MMTTPPAAERIADAARSGAPLHVCVEAGTSAVAEMWLAGGRLVAASAEGADHRLGPRLVATGSLPAAEMQPAETAARSAGIDLLLSLTGRVRRDALMEVALAEAKYALAAALAAPPADVTFDDAPPPETLLLLDVNATSMLDEASAFLDAIAAAETVAPAASVPTRQDLGGAGGALTPEQWAVLERCDGSRRVADIAEECGLPVQEASVVVAGLVFAGLVAVAAAAETYALLAELDAAQDLQAIAAALDAPGSSAFDEPLEPALYIAPPTADDVTLVDPPEVIPVPATESASFESELEESASTPEPEDAPVAEVVRIGAATIEAPREHVGIDMASLMRELASLSRDDSRR